MEFVKNDRFVMKEAFRQVNLCDRHPCVDVYLIVGKKDPQFLTTVSLYRGGDSSFDGFIPATALSMLGLSPIDFEKRIGSFPEHCKPLDLEEALNCHESRISPPPECPAGIQIDRVLLSPGSCGWITTSLYSFKHECLPKMKRPISNRQRKFIRLWGLITKKLNGVVYPVETERSLRKHRCDKVSHIK